MNREYIPLNKCIMIKPILEVKDEKSGIIIPTGTNSFSNNDKFQLGEVLKLGSGKDPITGNQYKFDVKVGDKVLYMKYSGMVMDDGNVICTENEVACIVKGV